VADEYEHADRYPKELADRMAELGFFGLTIPSEYGGSGLSLRTYALVVEEIARGWMSLTGIFSSHDILCHMILEGGTEDQRRSWLPLLTSGRKRGGFALTEPNAGSDAQAIETRAVPDGDHYVVNGSKMFTTNGRHGDVVALMVKTDPDAQPPYRGISAFIAEKGPGFKVVQDIKKLGYKGVKTCELHFDNYRVPAENLIGGVEGRGFKQALSALEIGRINVASRGLGIARAAFEDAIRYAQQRETFGVPIWEHQAIQLKLADMGTKLEAARLLVLRAAELKDEGGRRDLEVGMAKLMATEVAKEVAEEAMRIHGGYGYTEEFRVERYYRDAPLLIIGEGTNELQRLIIARRLVAKHAL
jgi:alkylation response protein AidB-like acyl-CoA dehydrogenase